MKFNAIEGLRGWLAMAVVFSHLTFLSPVPATGIKLLLKSAGSPAVLVFIIISGFVITHMIMVRKDTYYVYIIKRFARIFPLFAVTCAIGFITSDMLAVATAGLGDPIFVAEMNGVAISNHQNLTAHIVTHLTMLHGAVPFILLPYSEYAFNIPAWSISLEWQFYLIAPLVVMLFRNKKRYLALVAIAAIVQLAYRRLDLGNLQPSALPAAAVLFLIGILCRLIYDKIESFLDLRTCLIAAILLFPMAAYARPILIWAVVYAGLANKQSGWMQHVYDLAFKSRVALYFGSRSYAIYLMHFPLLSFVAWLFVTSSIPFPGMIVLSCVFIPPMILIAEVAHRLIEQPGIAAGKYLASLVLRRAG